MPTIKISFEVKEQLDNIMADKLRNDIVQSKGVHKKELFMLMVKRKYGLTYNDILKEILKRYTRYTR